MIKFGPSGNSLSFYAEGNKHTYQAPAWLKARGLAAYEYSFGRGINISDDTAKQIGAEAAANGVEISVHAPYYINFANPSDEMAEKSYNYVINSCYKLQCFGGNRTVFHPAAVGKATRGQAVQLTLKRLNILAEKILQHDMQNYLFCPETMGKLNQVGTLEEVVEFCKVAPFFVPAVDFGHLNARTFGAIKTKDDYKRMIEYMLQHLGFEKTKNMHIHFSKIEYGSSGEIRHLTFADNIFGPEFEPLAEVLWEYKLQPFIVCESDGTQAEDAIAMQSMYNNIANA